jgi:hypothetical protein
MNAIMPKMAPHNQKTKYANIICLKYEVLKRLSPSEEAIAG